MHGDRSAELGATLRNSKGRPRSAGPHWRSTPQRHTKTAVTANSLRRPVAKALAARVSS
jgi:hypothetical protein